MTLDASPTPAEIVAELGESFPYTFPDAKTRWLAEVGTSDPITFPTDFANKMSVKVVATASTGASNSSGTGTHTFSGVDFGAAFTGRVLVACIGLFLGSDVTLNQSSCTIGGVSATGGDSGSSGGGETCGGGVWAAALDTGASGDVVINWSGGTVAKVGLILLSVSGISAAAHDETTDWFTAGTGDTQTLDIPSNGVLIAAFAHGNTNSTTMTGVTKREEITFTTSGGGANLCVGFDNRKDEETGDSVTVSWTSSARGGGEARSYQQ